MVPSVEELLAFAVGLADEGHRASALVDLVPRLAAERLDAVLDVAFSDEHRRVRVMHAVLCRAAPAQVARIRSAVGQLTLVWPRYHLLFALLPHLGDEERAAVVDGLVATLERHPDFELADRVRALAPRLRPDQLDRLVEFGLRGEDGAAVLAGVWGHLSDSRRGALVGEVAADPAAYHGVMGMLGSRLGADPLAVLLRAVYAIDDDGARCQALAGVAGHLPEPARSAAIEASVAAAVAAMEAQVKRWARVYLGALLPQAGHGQVGSLLAAEQAARGRGMDSNVAAIVPFASPSQLVGVVADAIAPVRLGEPLPESAPISLTVTDLVTVIPFLPEGLQDAAVRTVLPRFDPLMYRIPRLSAGQAAEVLRRIDVRAAPWEVARCIGYLAGFLGGAGLDEAMAVVLAVEDEGPLGEALVEIAPWLGREHLARVLRAATGIGDAGIRAYTLVRLAPHLDRPGTVEAAMSAALSVPDPEDRALRLLEVAALLPAGARAAVLGPAWAALAAMPPSSAQVVTFERLAGLV